MIEPVCTAEAIYWRSGLRWKIVLQVMYYTDRRRGRGQGPFFTIGHAWRAATARARTEEANGRLARSELVIRRETLCPDGRGGSDERHRSHDH